MRATQAQSLLWNRREVRWAQYGSPGSTATVGTGSTDVLTAPVSAGKVAVGTGSGAVAGGMIGSGPLRCRVLSNVDLNSSLARRNARRARAFIRPSSWLFAGPKT